MTAFSANLGFMWRDRSLAEAIRSAAAAGFDAVECHWPYATSSEDVAFALAETGMKMLGLNTNPGHPGELGLAAIPGREAEARAEIDRAISYARAIDCGSVHVMAGFAEGTAASQTFLINLDYACRSAPELTFLIEPLNHFDAPGYFLSRSDHAAGLIEVGGHTNLKMMFDCYHIQIMEGDVTRRLRRYLPIIGHVQIASVPDRAVPDHGELDYRHVCATLAELGWTRPLGAEYRPVGEDGDLARLQVLRAG